LVSTSVSPFTAHRFHRNAIGETVTFVRTLTIEFEPCKKRFPALRNHCHAWLLQNIVHSQSHLAAHEFGRSAKERQVFAQNFIGRNNFIGELFGTFVEASVESVKAIQ
jgi:hypothetical protein